MALELPASLTQSWHQCGTRTAETNVSIAEITAEMTLFEPLESVLPDRAGSDVPVRSLFTVDVDVAPPLSVVGISPSSALSMAAPTVKSQFGDTIEDEDLVVEGTRDTLEFEASNGEAGTWYVLDVAYPLETTATDGEGATLAAESHLAIWPTDSTFGIAGGTLPLDGVDKATGSDSPPQGFDVDPESDRETIAELVQTLDC